MGAFVENFVGNFVEFTGNFDKVSDKVLESTILGQALSSPS